MGALPIPASASPVVQVVGHWDGGGSGGRLVVDLEEIRRRIEALHKRRLASPLDDDELAELRALYEQEHEAQQTRNASRG